MGLSLVIGDHVLDSLVNLGHVKLMLSATTLNQMFGSGIRIQIRFGPLLMNGVGVTLLLILACAQNWQRRRHVLRYPRIAE